MAVRTEIHRDDGIPAIPGVDGIIERVCNECTRAHKEKLCAGVYLTDDTGIREKNLEFRKIDAATDVLSFPLLDSRNGKLNVSAADRDMERDCILMGDIVVSMDKVREQAVEYGHSEERELAFLICHGMLHLLGYDHETHFEEKRMHRLQEKVLGSLGYTRREES